MMMPYETEERIKCLHAIPDVGHSKNWRHNHSFRENKFVELREIKFLEIGFAVFEREGMADKARNVLLAETWDESVDPTGWWISEKVSGF
jgi:hypothetical protein